MKKLTIILDAAHGEDTPGKCAPDMSHREYRWSRDFIKILKPLLLSEGYSVYETNPTEKEIGLSTRVKVCNAVPGDNKFFISLHNNAAGNGQWMNARGYSIWTTKGQTTSDIYADIIMKQIEKDFPGYEGFKERKDLSDGDLDYEANFSVLMCKCPAVLLEWLFQDNKEDLVLIKDKKISERLAISLVQAFNKINDLY